MKFTTLKFLAIFYIFIIFNSNILAFEEKKRHKINTHRRVNHFTTNRMKGCEPPKEFNWLVFFLGVISTAKASLVGDIVKKLKDKSKTDQIGIECTDYIKNLFEKQSKEFIDENKIIEKIQENNKKLGDKIKALGLSQKDTDELERERSNPRRLCEIRVKILKNKIQEKKIDPKKLLREIQTLLNKLNINDNSSFEKLQKKIKGMKGIKGFFASKAEKVLYKYLEMKFPNQKPAQWKNNLETAKKEITEEFIKKSFSELTKNIPVPNCSQIPTTLELFEKCVDVTIAQKARVFWGAVKEMAKTGEWKDCLGGIFNDQLINKFLAITADLLITIVTDIFGFFVAKISKIIYNAIIVIYHIKKAVDYKNNDFSKFSKHVGKAVGVIIKIALLLSRNKGKK